MDTISPSRRTLTDVISRFSRADEEPVLGSDLCGTNHVFDEFVIDLKTTVVQVAGEAGPLSEGVGDCPPQVALGKVTVCFLPVVEDLLEPLEVRSALEGADGLAKYGASPTLAELDLDAVKGFAIPLDLSKTLVLKML